MNNLSIELTLCISLIWKVPQQTYDNQFENLFLELLRDQNVRTLHLWIVTTCTLAQYLIG